jgi:hypothetical protein
VDILHKCGVLLSMGLECFAFLKIKKAQVCYYFEFLTPRFCTLETTLKKVLECFIKFPAMEVSFVGESGGFSLVSVC